MHHLRFNVAASSIIAENIHSGKATFRLSGDDLMKPAASWAVTQESGSLQDQQSIFAHAFLPQLEFSLEQTFYQTKLKRFDAKFDL